MYDMAISYPYDDGWNCPQCNKFEWKIVPFQHLELESRFLFLKRCMQKFEKCQSYSFRLQKGVKIEK